MLERSEDVHREEENAKKAKDAMYDSISDDTKADAISN